MSTPTRHTPEAVEAAMAWAELKLDPDEFSKRHAPILLELKERPTEYTADVAARILAAEVLHLRGDAVRIDALETAIKKEPLLLHNCNDRSEFPKNPVGLGLLPWSPRTLRQAIDSCVIPIFAAQPKEGTR